MIDALIHTAVRILIGWLLIDRVPAWLNIRGIVATNIKSYWSADYYQCLTILDLKIRTTGFLTIKDSCVCFIDSKSIWQHIQ